MPSSDSASVSLGISRVTDASRAAIEPVAETLALAFNDHITHAINGGYWPELTLARMCGAATTTVLDLECYVAHLPGSTGADAVMLVKPPGIEHGAR
jgi:hypothetical protein